MSKFKVALFRGWAACALLALALYLHNDARRRSAVTVVRRVQRANADVALRRIPPTVWRTWRSSALSPTAARHLARFEQLNPEFEHRLVNDSEAAQFMREHFAGRVADAYFSINPLLGAARADLWRYCQLYHSGGFYVDLDVGCRVPLRSLYGARDALVHSYEHTRLPRAPPHQMRCLGRGWFDDAAGLLAHAHVRESGFRPFTIAQSMLGSAPRQPMLRAAIDFVVDALGELREEECALPPPGLVSARDRAKRHTWTWMRTIWLTGPFALTVAFHNFSRNNPGAADDLASWNFKTTCASSRAINSEMDGEHVKYQYLADHTPFLVRPPIH